jgi:ABC-type dipeptide/oligopeptide/nickel transport system permease component
VSASITDPLTPADETRPTLLSELLHNRWLRMAGRRIAWLIGSLWILITAGFFMIHLVPGDPVRQALGRNAPAATVEERRHQLGLDQSTFTQYLHYLANLPRGHMGTSLFTGQPVADAIGSQIKVSLSLALWSFLVVVVVAVPVGVVAAALTRGGRRRRVELGFTSTGIIVATLPSFILAEVLTYVFSVHLGWFPIAGRSGPASYVLPVISLAAGPTAILTRVVRIEMLAVLDRDYIRTARSKRLPLWRIYLREALPNALTATLTVAGLMLTGLVAGTVLVENVFSWPGLGTDMVTSIRQKDYPLVQGIIIVYGTGVVVINLLVDLVLGAIDPRSTLSSGASK